MADFPSVNEQALHLVARELATTLNDVRIALEAAAETPGDKTPIAKSAELLHGARGVLRVVEVYGAALLAEEMEHTSRWLAGNTTDARQLIEGLDALMRSSVQLPTYLERVLGGGRDLALVLLPLLNDLRAVRGAPLLSEGTLLSLNLSSEKAPATRAPRPGEPKLSVPQWARRLRPRFQAGLLSLIRGEREDRGLISLSEVAARMEANATTVAVYQLWWVTGALLDALRSGGIAASVTIKRLLGQADRELKRLYEQGEAAYSESPPIELLNNLLFYVARAETRGERIDAVRASFRLDELLPVDESVERERESLSAPSVRLMRTVAAAIKEDLGRVKDALDLYTRKGGPPEELAPQLDLLKKIGDTLAVLGLGSMREQVQGVLARLADIIGRRVPAEQNTLIDSAATLIGIEDGLDDALVRLIMPPGAPAPDTDSDPEFRHVTEAVLRECIVNLARIKELLGASLDPISDAAGADAAPVLARGITAGLLLLGRNRAMEVMRRIGLHVADVVRPGAGPRSDEFIDRLADAIVGIEYYMETLQAGRSDPWYMLDNAERCLAVLDQSLAGGAPAPAAEPEPAPPVPAPAPVAAAETRRPAAVEPELVALFIEEAGEEIATIGRLFPLWDENPADRESLTRVRRAFHTLKGSGRMVGAHRIGDLAWSIENLLNRLIDRTLERSAPMLATLRDAIALLPPLVAELEGHSGVAQGVEAVSARANVHAAGQAIAVPASREAAAAGQEPTQILARLDDEAMSRLLAAVPPVGAPVPPAPVVKAAMPEPVPEPQPAPLAAEPPEAAPAKPAEEAWIGRPAAYAEGGDSSLQEIYQKEVQSHLEVIRAYLRRAWLVPGTHVVTEDLYRACHTLRGASRTADIRHSVRLAEPLHRWLRRMFDHDCSFDEAGLAILADCVVGFEDILAATHESTGHFTNLDRLVRRIEEQDSALERRLAEQPAQPPAPPEPVVEAREEPPPAVEPELPPEPTRLSLESLVPGVVADAAIPERDVHGLLPTSFGETGIVGAPPYLQPAAAPAEAEEEPQEPTPARSEDYDPDVAAIFSEEATELLEAADAALGALRAERGSRERVTELQRALHTLKGGARMAGIGAMGDLSHELEWLLMHVGDDTVQLDERSLEVLQSSLDELNRMRDYVGAGRPVESARDLITRIRLIGRGRPALPVAAPPAVPEAAAAPAPPAPVEMEAVPEPELVPEPEIEREAEEPAFSQVAAPAVAGPPTREAGADRGDVARVDAELLDNLLNVAGEVSIFRARLEQQLSSIDFNLAELGRVVQRLKDQLRKLEIETEAQILHRHVNQGPRRDDFDPLELDRYSTIQQYSRALAETSSDVASVQGLLANQTREAQNLLIQQGRIVSELQGGLMRTRMVPFQRHAQRLTRIVRQAAAETGKKVELRLGGAAGELDRQVLERMLPPFEHMLRNAIVHGIEAPAARVAAGKSETGRIDMTLRREGSEVVITVADDGAGVNLKAVRDRAVSLGLMTPKQELSDEQALQLILEPGFSTAGKVTQSAGRGVGMDVVATEIKKLGGSLYTETEPGKSTRFTVRLPFTLAISQALVVRVGDELFALPLPTVEGVVRVPRSEVLRHLAEDAAGFDYGGQKYRFQHLAVLVGGTPAVSPEHDVAVPVILVRAGEHSTAIVTDELIGSREIVVKSVGPQISGIRGISGATILGDGRICVILDVGALVRSEWRQRPAPDPRLIGQEDRRVFALVVDDSITVRRVTQRLLERNGMRVVTAKDGLEAVAVLQDEVPDVILLDIEMPRMDGYEVASHVRNDPRLKDIPIVMITSRVGEKHRARAIELGVNEYLGKPYQEGQLLQAIEPLVRREVS
ncbi:MAG TPA: Hpt domain-containing protein [Steroidobacteraceae bacterium]|nr:Hpt domain-containing protein [Steroidobacteraceae bacterium]